MGEGHSQDVPDEGSLFNVSLLSPGLVVRPTRVSGAAPSEGVLLPTMLEDFDDSVLGDPITYAQFEQFPGSESPVSLTVYAWPPSSAFLMDSAVIRTVLAPGKSELLAAGISEDDPPYSGGAGQVVRDRTAGLSIPILGVQRTPVYRWKPGICPTAALSSLVGAPESARLLDCSPSFWVVHLGKEKAMAATINLQRDAGVMLSNLQILSQFAMAMNRMSFSMMALGLGQSLFPKVEVNDLAPAPRTARAASYMSAMGLWHPQKNPGAPGPVPVSSCHSYINYKYCFPENQLPPESTF